MQRITCALILLITAAIGACSTETKEIEHAGVVPSGKGKEQTADVHLLEISGSSLILTIHDVDVIESAIIQPMAEKKENLRPAKWIILGALEYTAPDGETVSATLFMPLGHVQIQEKYYDVDFQELNQYITKKLDETKRDISVYNR